MKTPTIAAFVGYAGDNVWLEPSQQHADDDPMVQSWPDLFDDMPQGTPQASPEFGAGGMVGDPIPAKRGVGRPKGSTNKPRD